MRVSIAPFVLLAAAGSFVTAHLIGCSSPPPPPAVEDDASNPLNQFLDAGALALPDFSATTFNPRVSPLRFTLAGSTFDQNVDHVVLTINGNIVSSGQITVQADAIVAAAPLDDGRNDVVLAAADAVGRSLHLRATLWAGDQTLQVSVLDENGQPLAGPADVTATLGDDLSVLAKASTTNGTVQFEHIPDRTIVIKAVARGNRRGLIGTVGSQGSIAVRLRGFNPPSAIANNDFSLGTDGWEVGTAPVQIVPHVEPRPAGLAGVAAKAVAGVAVAAAAVGDSDLSLNTSGEGEQSISRTFDTQPGTTAVQIQYAFLTSELPGGYFGTKYNDYFSVSLRSEKGGGSSDEANSMNGLGQEAFDAGGATEYRKVVLEVDKQGDTVQADVAVANVADAKFDSSVVVTEVKEIKDQVKPTLAWNTAAGGMNLTYQVVDGELANDTTIEVFWASGPAYENRIGAAVFSQTVPKGTAEGQYGPVPIAGNLLADDPDGVTHLIAAASETSVGALADVRINYGANADAAAVSAGMIDIIKDGMRAAGTATAMINSTARSPADQARAMFQNLARDTDGNGLTQQEIDNNTNVQHNGDGTWPGYGAGGDAVIDVFTQQIAGQTPAEVLANQGTIRDAMEQEINNQGPTHVSRHCADPAVVSVVDIGTGAFVNGALFVTSVQGRVTNYLDEGASNGCYHLELNAAP